MTKNYFYGLGRRKSATARARLYTGGKGKITINDQTAEEYLADSQFKLWDLNRPLALLSHDKDVDVSLKVSGGGVTGQVDACKLAIAKALSAVNEDNRSTLKKAGFLKRDPREKERKKAGLKRARKAEQYTKR